MSDHFEIETWKSIQADSGDWYKSVEFLGVGGNAVTFLAYSTTPPRKGLLFAIKVFRRLSKPERKESFLKETEYLKNSEHPAVMRIHDEGTYYGEYPFVVMEYLPYTLADLMRRGCGFVEKVTYANQLVSALDFLESSSPQVVHRDIKPANIFVKGGSCVLGDFGLMKALTGSDEDEDREIVKESVGPGMPRYYRTPDLVEYLKGASGITPASDVFQLGLVLTELFTGWNPCRKGDFQEVVKLDQIGKIPSPHGERVRKLLKRMLRMDSAKRPKARELIDGWEKVFKDVVNSAHNVEERAFHF